ncbi:hypothetical protein BD31_I0253 [Candidatus Nitrosopumilus salaria BD31]|uniref:Uncharacterized protein n=1 Tax=Candidatus Nitrosopumilus salarius BD31 TaxID=859350 RepID=I3D4W9_9ARCH|nr:hypothetical protein BD31_I0253 [Candidatus Nitrosopumilus salaria BD31]
MRNILKPQSGTQSGTAIPAKKIINFLENWCAEENSNKIHA